MLFCETFKERMLLYFNEKDKGKNKISTEPKPQRTGGYSGITIKVITYYLKLYAYSFKVITLYNIKMITYNLKVITHNFK